MKLYICLNLLLNKSSGTMCLPFTLAYNNANEESFISVLIIHIICDCLIFFLQTVTVCVIAPCPCFCLRSLCSRTDPMDMSTLPWTHLPSPHLLMYCGCLRTRGAALPRPGKHINRHSTNTLNSFSLYIPPRPGCFENTV